MEPITQQPDTDVLANIEGRLTKLEGVVYHNGLGQLQASVAELTRVVDGDEKLNVPPLRDTVEELDTAYRRAKWVVATLAISNVGGLVGIASLLLGVGK